MSFFHGVKNIAVPTANGTVAVAPSCVIGLIGVSPWGPVQTLTLCNNATDDEQWSYNTPDNNIAKTLGIIRGVVSAATATMSKGGSSSDGSCAIVIVNVYNSGTNKVTFSLTNKVPDASTGKLALGVTILDATLDLVEIHLNSDSSAVNVAAGGGYEYGTDYTLDVYGNFQDITGNYMGVGLNFSGHKLDPTTVTGAQIIGGTSGSTKTGLALLDRCMSTYGFKAKILITPTYNTLSGVAAAMEAAAGKFTGIYLSDMASGNTVSTALSARGSGIWDTQAAQTRPVWPWMKAYDTWANADVIYPYAAFLAGMYVANDTVDGYWESVSNNQIPLIDGVEVEISTDFTDSGSEANELNAAGILTYMTGYGLGYNTWGNRNASFPASSSVLTFDNVYRTDGLVADAMVQAALPFVDKGITAALIDVMKTSGNNFIKGLIQEGALLPGSAITYDKADNTAANLAAGKIAFRRTYMVVTPAEDIDYYDVLDVSLYVI